MKEIHQQVIKENNLKRVITLIRNSDGISRAQIAQQTKLSKTTVSSLVEDLIDMGYVLDSGETITKKQGRRPNKLHINSEKLVVIVVNLQPNYVEGAIVDLSGRIIMIDSLQDFESYSKATETIYYNLIGGSNNSFTVLSLCVVFPGSICENGKFLTTVLSLSENESDTHSFKKLFPDITVAFFNDTACIAYSEKLSFSSENRTYIYVNMGKGIGAILFNDGKLLRAANGMTTQFGHFSIDKTGVNCECGNKGCLEKIIGEKALSKLARNFDVDDPENITYKIIGQKVAQKQDNYIKLLDEMAENLAHAISNMVTIYNVPQIIIGGKAMLLGKNFLDKVVYYIKENGFRRFTSDLELTFSKFPLDHKAELSGAAQYYIDMHHSFLSDNRGKIYF